MIVKQREESLIEYEENGHKFIAEVFPLNFYVLHEDPTKSKSGISWDDLTDEERAEEQAHMKKAHSQYPLYNYFGMNNGNKKFYDKNRNIYRVQKAFPCMFLAQKVLG